MTAGTLVRPPEESVRSRRILLAVARFETTRVWRHPALIIAVLVTGFELYRQVDWSRAPVLNRDSFTTAWPMIFLAAGVFLSIGSAAHRRHAVEEDDALQGLPVSPTTQAIGIGLAFVSPLLVGIVMQGTALVLRALDGPVTSIVWSEVLTGPLTVALGAAAGLAIGYGFRSPLALPISIVGFAGGILTVWWANSGYLLGPYTPWLAPVTSLDWNQYTYEQAYRPSSAHAVYLLLLVGFFGFAAAVRGRSGRERFVSVAAAVFLLGGAVLAGIAQLNELTPAEETARQAPFDPVAGNYICEDRATVTYCAYVGYEVWIEEWVAQIEPVLASMPEEVTARPLGVRQQIPYYLDGEELPQVGNVMAGMWWSRRPVDANYVSHPLGMALATAGWAVGFPDRDLPIRTTLVDDEIVAEPVDDPAAVDPDELHYRSCRADGQARAVAAMWYAAQATPESTAGLEFLTSGERYGGIPTGENVVLDLGYRQPSSSVIYYRKEAIVALDLDRLPADQVRDTLTARWEEVTDPSTTTEELATWFGITVPEMSDADQMGTIPCP